MKIVIIQAVHYAHARGSGVIIYTNIDTLFPSGECGGGRVAPASCSSRDGRLMHPGVIDLPKKAATGCPLQGR